MQTAKAPRTACGSRPVPAHMYAHSNPHAQASILSMFTLAGSCPLQQEAAGQHSAAAVITFTGRLPYLEKSFSQHNDARYTSPSISVISHSMCCITRAAMPLMVAGAGPRMPRNALQAIAQSSKGPHLHQQTEFKNAHTASLAPLCFAIPSSKRAITHSSNSDSHAAAPACKFQDQQTTYLRSHPPASFFEI